MDKKNKEIDAKGEKASPSIPKPTKKQDLVGNKRLDSKMKIHDQNISMTRKMSDMKIETHEESKKNAQQSKVIKP